jgi:uncharacterized coiled-coil protein SlyX
MTAHHLGRVLDEIDRRLKAQDRLIAALQAEIQNLYARLRDSRDFAREEFKTFSA